MSDFTTALEMVALGFKNGLVAGEPPSMAAESAVAGLLPLLPELAQEEWAVLRPALIKLLLTPAQPGFEGVTSTDTARSKLAAELEASGAALPDHE